MTTIESILEKYDFQWRIPSQTITVADIEEKIKFRLPDDYRFFLDNYIEYESFIGPEYLRLWDLDSLLENNIGYEIFELNSNILGIGTNAGGECIAIDHLDGISYSIILSPFIGFGREDSIDIGSSFTDMLVRLDEGKNWFT